MLVSVIVPVYNVAKYLPSCIESILSQTYRDFELLLIDDGSTDGSIEICKKYAQKDNRIKVFKKENGGVSSARNLGINNCLGEWVSFVDGDDYVGKQYLSNMLMTIQQKSIDLVVAGFYRVDDTTTHNIIDKWAYQKGVINAQNITFKQLENLTFWGVSVSKLFRSAIIRQNRLLFSDIPLKEDVLFLFEYINCCRLIRLTTHNDYYYIQRNGSALNSNLSFKQRILRQKLFRKEVLSLHLSRPIIKEFALHNGEWSIISESYSFCSNPIKRFEIIRDLTPAFLNSKCLTEYSLTKVDAFCIWLLKHKCLIAFDIIKRTQVHLLNFISAFYKLKKRWFSR